MTVDFVWKQIPLSPKQLSLARVLRCGQTFRWKSINSVWTFSTADEIILLRQEKDALHYASIGRPAAPSASAQAFVADYFNLSVDVEHLYEAWGTVAKKHSAQGTFLQFPGIRMLRQDPWETVVSFICSANNNVKRISKMCDALCTEFGELVGEYGGVEHFSFPGPEKLAAGEVEGRLRALGFGYRAKYIQQTAAMFVDEAHPAVSLEHLHQLRTKSYEEAHAFLLQLKGVGPKVADCICLMALDKHDVVPVDTHVMQIAARDYKFRGAQSAKAYHQVRKHLQGLFGAYAGWAQLVMFAADLADLDNGVNRVDGAAVKHEVEVEHGLRKRAAAVKRVKVKKVKVEKEALAGVAMKVEEVKVEL